MKDEDPPLLGDTWPRLAAELALCLHMEGEGELAKRVDSLRVLRRCGCGDEFCQSFYTQPKPVGAYGPGHRCVCLNPPWPGMLILDVVDDLIMYVEVLDRHPLD